jgi:hypothetical protein
MVSFDLVIVRVVKLELQMSIFLRTPCATSNSSVPSLSILSAAASYARTANTSKMTSYICNLPDKAVLLVALTVGSLNAPQIRANGTHDLIDTCRRVATLDTPYIFHQVRNAVQSDGIGNPPVSRHLLLSMLCLQRVVTQIENKMLSIFY